MPFRCDGLATQDAAQRLRHAEPNRPTRLAATAWTGERRANCLWPAARLCRTPAAAPRQLPSATSRDLKAAFISGGRPISRVTSATAFHAPLLPITEITPKSRSEAPASIAMTSGRQMAAMLMVTPAMSGGMRLLRTESIEASRMSAPFALHQFREPENDAGSATLLGDNRALLAITAPFAPAQARRSALVR